MDNIYIVLVAGLVLLALLVAFMVAVKREIKKPLAIEPERIEVSMTLSADQLLPGEIEEEEDGQRLGHQ